MNPYRPDKFAHTYLIYDGHQFWTWLHQANILLIMETASYLRRPAIEGISPLLEEAFPNMLHRVKLRQMIGHMVRQILEARGYHLDRANVRIRLSGNVFRYGSAYQKSAA